MSDFLKKFSQENYDQTTQKEKLDAHASQTKTVQPEPEQLVDDTLQQSQETESLINDTDAPMNEADVLVDLEGEDEAPTKSLDEYKREDANESKDEEVEIDDGYKARKRKQYLFIGAGVTVALIIGFILFHFMTTVKYPNFVGKPVTEFQQWAKGNSIKAEVTEEYSLVDDTGVIMKQATSEGKRVKKGSTQGLVVSKGADPQQVVPLPDVASMNETEINKWVKDNKMENIKVVQEYSTDVEKGKFIRHEIRDKDVTPETLKRKDTVTIFVSKGAEVFSKDIKVPDFKGKTKADVEAWHKEKKFVSDFVYEEGYDDKLEVGMIISQGTAVDTQVSKDESLTFVVSKGKAIYVPDFSQISMGEFKDNPPTGVNATLKEWYSGYAYGTFLEQSIAPGTNIAGTQDTSVKVYYSIGKPYVGELIGMKENELAAYFYAFRDRGANISYSVSYVKPGGCEPKGTVVGATKYSQYVAMEDHVSLTVSNGNCN